MLIQIGFLVDSREKIIKAINHKEEDRVPINVGGTLVTCIQKPNVKAYWRVITAYIVLKGMDTLKKFYLSSPLITHDSVGEFLQYSY